MRPLTRRERETIQDFPCKRRLHQLLIHVTPAWNDHLMGERQAWTRDEVWNEIEQWLALTEP